MSDADRDATNAHNARMAARRWRWRPEIGRWFIGVREEVFLDDEWHPRASSYAIVGIAKPWQRGMFHDWYDGPHHALWLGFLYFNWTPMDWCCKCMPCEADECPVCGWLKW